MIKFDRAASEQAWLAGKRQRRKNGIKERDDFGPAKSRITKARRALLKLVQNFALNSLSKHA